MKKILPIAALLLSGCVSATPTTLADGSRGEIVRCPGMARSMADCFQKAGEVCPAGYDIIGENGEVYPFAMANGGFSATSSSAQGGYSGFSGSVIHRSLMIRCH